MYVTRYIPSTQYAQGSAMSFACYLEKEALIHDKLSDTSSRQLSAYLDKQNDVVRGEGREYFFNGDGQTYNSENVTKAIDANVKGLKKSEAHYYTFTISPSSQEITHLRRMIADTKSALCDAGEIIPDGYEDELLRTDLKEYCLRSMDAYARNFGHPEMNNNKDLLWFGMVEKDRYWKKGDEEVRANVDVEKEIHMLERRSKKHFGKNLKIQQQIEALQRKYIREYQVRPGGSQEIIRPMMAKAGDNWHIHVTVSRRDATNSFCISPNANGRGSKNHMLNGQSVRVGFDREKYKIRCENIFDETFLHDRLQTESYQRAKELREESAFVFEKLRLKDLAARRAENIEYSQMKVAGYNDYYENLVQMETQNSRQLMKMKRHIVRQVRKLHPELNVSVLMKYDLEELQDRFGQMDMEQASSNRIDGFVASCDYVSSAIGLPVHRPFHTVHKVLNKGIMINKAVNLRRETYDKWFGIYEATWQRDNYLFDSIAERQNTEYIFAQVEYINQQFGESILLGNAQDYLMKIEQKLVGEYLIENWADRVEHIVSSYAIECFGQDGKSIHSLLGFNEMAHERLLPNHAVECIREAKNCCELPQNLAALQQQIEAQQMDRMTALTAKLESFLGDRGQDFKALGTVLGDSNLSVVEKEKGLMTLARENKALDKTLRNFREGLIKILKHQRPGMEYGNLKDTRNKILDEMQQLKQERQKQLVGVINNFITESIPNYHLVVEKQSELERLLKEISPNEEAFAERLIEVNNELTQQLSPQVEQLFKNHSQRLFGPDVLLRNEHDFVAYVDVHYTGAQANQMKESLKSLYAKIEQKRKEDIQNFVKQLPSKQLDKVRYQQSYINRYINRQQVSAAVVRSQKEDLQRRIAAACDRVITPMPEYKVFSMEVSKQIATQATLKVNQIKAPLITPQQVVLKASLKLISVLTKGY